MHGGEVDEEEGRGQGALVAAGRVPFEQKRADDDQRRGELRAPVARAGGRDDGRSDEPHRRRLPDRRLEGHPAHAGCERQRPVAIGDGELKRGVAQRLAEPSSRRNPPSIWRRSAGSIAALALANPTANKAPPATAIAPA